MGWLRIYLCGVAIGVAELIPGISGGTIAFITGIYERLVKALGSFNISWLRTLAKVPLKRSRMKDVLEQVDALFLVVLVFGMFSAWLVTANLIQWLLETQRVLLWAALFGLMLGTIIMLVVNHYRQISLVTMPLALCGLLLGLVLSSIQLPSLTASPLLIVVMGGIATCAWLLPGLSGSFLMLITGFYHPFISAVAELKWSILALFALGAVICLPLFSAWLGKLLAHRKAETMLFLTALLLGSLKVLWPWQRTTAYFFSQQGAAAPQITSPVSPQTYATITGEEPQVLAVTLLALGTAALVIWLQRRASKPSAL